MENHDRPLETQAGWLAAVVTTVCQSCRGECQGGEGVLRGVGEGAEVLAGRGNHLKIAFSV